MQIEYRPVIGNGAGNETPFTIGNPYRRIRRKVFSNGDLGFFVMVKGKPLAVSYFIPESTLRGIE